MTSQFFEGAAGTGKTYNLMRSLEGLTIAHPLEKYQKILALTFMHGSRSRLEATLSGLTQLNRRYDCMTFDAFAGHIANRWRDLLAEIRGQITIPESNNEYERTCYEAAELLKNRIVQNWVRETHPIILVDEAQDLSPARLSMMQEMAAASILLAAADEYQHLDESHGNNEAVNWLAANTNVTRLTLPRRTSDQGLLRVAHNLRNAESIISILNEGYRGRKQLGTFTLMAVPTWQMLAWHTGFSLFSSPGHDHAILTLSASDANANNAINKVKQDTQNLNRSRGTTFGPFPDVLQERKVDVVAQECFASMGTLDDVISIDYAYNQCATIDDINIKEAVQRWCRKRQRVLGQSNCHRDDLQAAIQEAFQNRRRYLRGSNRTRQAMTIHQAKNREFDNVIVLWTYAIAGSASDEYQRRLLYNAITRAKQSCTVIVMGENRLNSAPFSISATPVLQAQG